jgi:hypothetical protein
VYTNIACTDNSTRGFANTFGIYIGITFSKLFGIRVFATIFSDITSANRG